MRSPVTVFLLGAIGFVGNRAAQAEVPPGGESSRPPHPEPRVIVNVLSVAGPHKADRVQHDARFGWKRIVRCYKSVGAKEAAVVTLELEISSEGSVAGARSVLVEAKDRELAACLVSTLPGLAMPKASSRSKADVEIRLAPGDRPPKH
jgi:predicted YcjX-like family ATPase